MFINDLKRVVTTSCLPKPGRDDVSLPVSPHRFTDRGGLSAMCFLFTLV